MLHSTHIIPGSTCVATDFIVTFFFRNEFRASVKAAVMTDPEAIGQDVVDRTGPEDRCTRFRRQLSLTLKKTSKETEII